MNKELEKVFAKIVVAYYMVNPIICMLHLDDLIIVSGLIS